MSTASTVRAWSTTDASNATADSNITSADTQSPDTLDNNVRSVMAAVAKQEADTGGGLAAGGTANALTVTTNQVLGSGQLTGGLRLLLRAASDNTSATVTFAPDGLTAANIKRADGSALAIGSIKSGMYLDLVYNSGSSEWRCANIGPAAGISAPGLVYLTSGTVAAATLDIVLTTYTQYRGLKFVLSGFVPATDGAAIWLRSSSDGGISYYTSGYNYARTEVDSDAANSTVGGSGSTGQIIMGTNVGSGAAEGFNAEITIFNQSASAFWGRFTYVGYYIDSTATPRGIQFMGGGAHEAAEDIDAVRVMFSAGNITAGNYAVYGLV